MNIGFIGLGNMGHPMATNILEAGYSLTVHDVEKAAASSLLEAGALWAETPEALAKTSDLMFTSLPGPQEVETVALGENGLIEGISSGKVYIDMSTNSPTLVRRIYSAFQEKGAHVMDSPVSGGADRGSY